MGKPWTMAQVEDMESDVATLNTRVDDVAGLRNKTTVFNADGSITETMAGNKTKTTTINSSCTVITEIYKTSGVTTNTKTTTFNSDESITEEVL